MNTCIKEGLDAGYEQEALSAYVEIVGEEYAALEGFEESYQGEWESNEEFVQDLFESCGEDIPACAMHYLYIDWERAARDVMTNYSEEEGHYFRNL